MRFRPGSPSLIAIRFVSYIDINTYQEHGKSDAKFDAHHMDKEVLVC